MHEWFKWPPFPPDLITYFGRLLEWLISSVWKTDGREIGTRVQIPYLPPVLYILERCMSGLSGLPAKE